MRLYPDPEASQLRQTIAEYHGLTPEQVFCGNGSDEVLGLCFYAFFFPGRRVIFPDITYSFYPVYAHLFQLDFEEIPLNEDFSFPVEKFLRSSGGAVVCNPNAPTGRTLPLEEICRILEADPNRVVIVDEAYADFGARSAVELLNRYPNLVTVHTLSKSRSLAGLRIGYALGSPDLMAAVGCVKNSFNSYPIDRLALAAGLLPAGTTFEQFLMLPTEMGGPGKTAEEAQMAVRLLEMSQEADFEEQLKLLDTANSAIPGVNDKIGEVNSLVSGLAKPTANVVDDLQGLTIALGEDGLSDDLTRLSKLASDLLKDQKDHGGDAAGLLDHLDELGGLADRVTQNADAALDLVQKLDDTLNTYEPQAQQALTDARALSDTAQAALKNTHAFLSSAESLLKRGGPSLDDGTRQTLSGLSDALRRSTAGLDQTGTIRSAKDTITDLIDDEWDSHTGGDNNLLLMDAGAIPASLTSEQNGNPQSIQYIMRTQEIKVEEESQQAPSQQSADQGTFWSRVAAMFRDFWNAITGLFRK